MEKLYYTIGEVASILGEAVSLVRFWTDTFTKELKPKRNAKGNRLYTTSELEVLKQIHFLVKDCGMTLEGAAKRMAEQRASVAARVKVIESLKDIRSQLVAIKKSF